LCHSLCSSPSLYVHLAKETFEVGSYTQIRPSIFRSKKSYGQRTRKKFLLVWWYESSVSSATLGFWWGQGMYMYTWKWFYYIHRQIKLCTSWDSFFLCQLMIISCCSCMWNITSHRIRNTLTSVAKISMHLSMVFVHIVVNIVCMQFISSLKFWGQLLPLF
jgi:hypothetical protein